MVLVASGACSAYAAKWFCTCANSQETNHDLVARYLHSQRMEQKRLTTTRPSRPEHHSAQLHKVD